VRVSAGGPPSGVVTFLFTDIEGSTRRWEADADAMRVALAAHDEVLHGAIEAHGGWLVVPASTVERVRAVPVSSGGDWRGRLLAPTTVIGSR
jgi:class 3 adenylate cyclase